MTYAVSISTLFVGKDVLWASPWEWVTLPQAASEKQLMFPMALSSRAPVGILDAFSSEPLPQEAVPWSQPWISAPVIRPCLLLRLQRESSNRPQYHSVKSFYQSNFRVSTGECREHHWSVVVTIINLMKILNRNSITNTDANTQDGWITFNLVNCLRLVMWEGTLKICMTWHKGLLLQYPLSGKAFASSR